MDFKEFIQGVSQFSVKGDKLSKLRFAFRIYDMDNDGYISNGELFQVSAPLITHFWAGQIFIIVWELKSQIVSINIGLDFKHLSKKTCGRLVANIFFHKI